MDRFQQIKYMYDNDICDVFKLAESFSYEATKDINDRSCLAPGFRSRRDTVLPLGNVILQLSLDYDFHLSSSNISDNTGNGITIPLMNRHLAITDSVLTLNGGNGIRVIDNHGKVYLTNAVANINHQSGLVFESDFGETSVLQSTFWKNGLHGVDIRFQSTRYHSYKLTIVNSSASYNEQIGIKGTYVTSSCNTWSFCLIDTDIVGNGHKALAIDGYNCYYAGYVNITRNSFLDNNNGGADLNYIASLTLEKNGFVNNTGSFAFRWESRNVHVSGTNKFVKIQGNTFIDNFGESVVKVSPNLLYRSSSIIMTDITDNVFENNSCFSVISFDWGQSTSYSATDAVSIVGNMFINNVARPYWSDLLYTIPVATIESDRPVLSIVQNIFENPLFHFEVVIVGDHFGETINATFNYWSTNDELEIHERIYDYNDEYIFCEVIFFPFLNSQDITDVVPLNLSRSFPKFKRGNTIGGVLNGTEVLLNTGIDYVVDSDITISRGGKLIIEPGVHLQFTDYRSVFVRGELIAVGTPENEISFKPLEPSATRTNATVRLVDGNAPSEGRLELLIGDVWYTMCSQYWTPNNAKVVCRQLGFFHATTSRYSAPAGGTGPILNQPFDCVGSEYNLHQCKRRDVFPGSCSHYNLDVAIRCIKRGWGGLFFPVDSSMSVLKHVAIHDAGYKLRWSNTNNIIRDAAVLIHLHHHVLENVHVQSPANIGVHVFYKNPFHDGDIYAASIRDCYPDSDNSHGLGMKFHSFDGFMVESCDVFNCYNGLDFAEETFYQNRANLQKYIGIDMLLDGCDFNVTLDVDEHIFIASTQLATIRSCTNTITTTTGDRIGVFIFYHTGSYSSVKVQENGYTTLNVENDNSFDFDNSFVSSDSTVTLIRQKTRNYDIHEYLILIKSINGTRRAFKSQSNTAKTLVISNTSYSRKVTNRRYGFGINLRPKVASKILISNATLCNAGTAIKIAAECRSVALEFINITDTNYGLWLYYIQNFHLTESVFIDVKYGIRSYYLVHTLIENVKFRSGSSAFHRFYNDVSNAETSNLAIRNCTFESYNVAVDIDARFNTDVYQDILIENCAFFENRNCIELGTFDSSSLSMIKNCTFFENGNAITTITGSYLTSSNDSSLNLIGNTFTRHTGIVLNMEYASQRTALVVNDNLFDSNDNVVLRIPNILPHCQIINNVFSNNTGRFVIDVYEYYPLNSVITGTFEHLVSKNILTENKPSTRWDDDDLLCAIKTHVHGSIIHDNLLNNHEFQYELCLGSYTYFEVDEAVHAKFNCWNTTDSSEIASKIFDQNDWNDRPSISYYPYSLCDGINVTAGAEHNETRSYLNLGGRVLEDLVLTSAEGPYHIQSDMTVPENITLTIEAGTELKFEPNIGLLVFGNMQAIGRKQERIKFHPAQNISLRNTSTYVRLTGHRNPWQGRLELYSDERWGSIYYYHWNRAANDVACRQMGFGGYDDYTRTPHFPIQGSPPDTIWFVSVRCLGDEKKLSDCEVFTLTECSNCGSYFHDFDTVLSCIPKNHWGGIRIFGTENSRQSPLILQYVDIVGAGFLHNATSPGLLVRRVADPLIDHLRIVDVVANGMVIDSPKSAVTLHNIKVTRCVVGIVLQNTDHVPVTLHNVSLVDNYLTGLTTDTQSKEIPDSVFGMIPMCSENDNDIITVDDYSEMIYQSRNRECEVIIKPVRNETLVLQIIRFGPSQYNSDDCFATVNVYDPDSILGQLSCSTDPGYVHIISLNSGASLLVSTDSSSNYNNDALGDGYLIRAWTIDANEIVQHVFVDCNFSFNKNAGMVYRDTFLNKQLIRIERCQFINNTNSTASPTSALSMNLQNAELNIENCLIKNNVMLGGIRIHFDTSHNDVRSTVYVLNNEFARNIRGNSMIVIIKSDDSSALHYVKIQGNLITENTLQDSSNIIDVNDVYSDLCYNTIFDNRAGRIIYLNQNNLALMAQECKNNVIIFNIAQENNEMYTIELISSGLQFYHNVIQNPANDYEINAISGGTSETGQDILNATSNWWGTTSSNQIEDRLRDSRQVIGFADVVYEPFLLSPPNDIRSIQCPTGYQQVGNACYGYRGGSVHWKEAGELCKMDGASLIASPYDVPLEILRSRSLTNYSINGVWIDVNGKTSLVTSNSNAASDTLPPPPK
ncbi:protein bark beetle-like [Amphiura filiformis]|uniref:protein bark beetle-like n=1 Tax=Amphiura filiformis TaxID=82378 RepID=UPI003B221746